MTLLAEIQGEILKLHSMSLGPRRLFVPPALREQLNREMRCALGRADFDLAPLHILGDMLYFEGDVLRFEYDLVGGIRG